MEVITTPLLLINQPKRLYNKVTKWKYIKIERKTRWYGQKVHQLKINESITIIGNNEIVKVEERIGWGVVDEGGEDKRDGESLWVGVVGKRCEGVRARENLSVTAYEVTGLILEVDVIESEKGWLIT